MSLLKDENVSKGFHFRSLISVAQRRFYGRGRSFRHTPGCGWGISPGYLYLVFLLEIAFLP